MKKISLVTAYYNRRKLFHNTLRTIEKNKNKDLLEIIVVDDASEDQNRIDDFPDIFDLDIKVIRIKPEEKNWVNPSIPFNIGFNNVNTDIVIIQNPECLHFGDIIGTALNKVEENVYVNFGAYSVDKTKTEQFNKLDFSKPSIFNNIGRLINPMVNRGIVADGTTAWYNHSKHRPHMLHFCSAISKKDLDELGGFDERYAHGVGFDDNDFILRIKRKGMDVNMIDRPFVIHQYHGNTKYGEKMHLYNKNALIYKEVLKNNK